MLIHFYFCIVLEFHVEKLWIGMIGFLKIRRWPVISVVGFRLSIFTRLVLASCFSRGFLVLSSFLFISASIIDSVSYLEKRLLVSITDRGQHEKTFSEIHIRLVFSAYISSRECCKV